MMDSLCLNFGPLDTVMVTTSLTPPLGDQDNMVVVPRQTHSSPKRTKKHHRTTSSSIGPLHKTMTPNHVTWSMMRSTDNRKKNHHKATRTHFSPNRTKSSCDSLSSWNNNNKTKRKKKSIPSIPNNNNRENQPDCLKPNVSNSHPRSRRYNNKSVEWLVWFLTMKAKRGNEKTLSLPTTNNNENQPPECYKNSSSHRSSNRHKRSSGEDWSWSFHNKTKRKKKPVQTTHKEIPPEHHHHHHKTIVSRSSSSSPWKWNTKTNGEWLVWFLSTAKRKHKSLTVRKETTHSPENHHPKDSSSTPVSSKPGRGWCLWFVTKSNRNDKALSVIGNHSVVETVDASPPAALDTRLLRSPQQPRRHTPPSLRNQISVCLVIGEGSFGRVWYGRHKPTNQEIALKVVDKCSCWKQPELITAIRTEQAILQSLRLHHHNHTHHSKETGESGNNKNNNNNHTKSWGPPVVQLLASFHDAECLYLVMECHKGGTLQDMISYMFPSHDHSKLRPQLFDYVKSLPWYARQLLDAISYIHSRGICHCDVKPANVLVSSNSRRLYLTDFGSAVQCSMPFSSAAAAEETTLHRTLQGTTSYSAPERLGITVSMNNMSDLKNRTRAWDLWALGCSVHALWVGASPFEAASDYLVTTSLHAYCQATEPSLPWRNHHTAATKALYALPAVWKDLLCNHLLHIDPVQRLRRALGSGGGRESSGEHPTARVVGGGEPFYPLLSQHAAWSQVQTQSRPSFAPPEPKWVQQVRENESLTWLDGSLGWSAFLM